MTRAKKSLGDKLVIFILVLLIGWVVFSFAEVGINNINQVSTDSTINFFNVVFPQKGSGK